MIKKIGKILLVFCFIFVALSSTAFSKSTTAFKLQISPGGEPVTQVIIHSIIDNTVPSITADVTISNEGTMDYEYSYQWCVVTSENNECGGGDDVFFASATKFIQAGEDWNTTLEATVPNPGHYWFKLIVFWDNSSSGSFITFTAEKEMPSPGGGGGIITPPATKATFRGLAYPSAEINILKDGEKIKTVFANTFAGFQAEISNLTPGNYIFTLWAKDTEKRRSIYLSYPVEIKKEGENADFNIFFPPSISLKKNSLRKNEVLKISGQSVPKGEISIFITPGGIIRKIIVDENGKWYYSFNTNILEKNIYYIKARCRFRNRLSTFSLVLPFGIEKAISPTERICLQADFNKDSEVNLVDFSIFLSWWGKYNPAIDLNQNGKVDLTDFSIFLSCWTG